MEYRRLGNSGLRVPALSFGTATFGGGNDFFKAWGSTDAGGAARLIDVCLDHGVSMFDSADVYSGRAGRGDPGRGDQGQARPAADLDQGDLPDRRRPERFRLVAPASGRGGRQGAARGWAPTTSTCSSSTARTTTRRSRRRWRRSTRLVRAGKVRYIGCSNFSGWHLMKSLAVSDRYGYPRYVAHQAYYSLLNRDYEWELMPLGPRPGRRRRDLEPARLGQAHRQDPPRPAGEARHAARTTSPAPARISTRSACSASSTRSTRSRRRPARPSRRSRSTGCCSGRRSPTSSSAPATRRSWSQNIGAVGWHADDRADRQARRGQRRAAGLSGLAPARLPDAERARLSFNEGSPSRPAAGAYAADTR